MAKNLGFAYEHFEDAKRVLDQGDAEVATVKEYADWLEGFLARGGKITHSYGYDMSDRVHIIRRDIDLPGLHGARSLRIIVPKGVKANFSAIGHGALYFMEGYQVASTFSVVPVYADVVAEMLRRGYSQQDLKATRYISGVKSNSLPSSAFNADVSNKSPLPNTSACEEPKSSTALTRDLTVKKIQVGQKKAGINA